jgi:hypothetical protein
MHVIRSAKIGIDAFQLPSDPRELRRSSTREAGELSKAGSHQFDDNSATDDEVSVKPHPCLSFEVIYIYEHDGIGTPSAPKSRQCR